MPVHDWTRVDDGVFHDVHVAWTSELRKALNGGLLPPDYFVMVEQVLGGGNPDVLALDWGPPAGPDQRDALEAHPDGGGVALRTAPPRARLVVQAEREAYTARQRRLVIRHRSGRRVVGLIELVSAGNKASEYAWHSFVNKSLAALSRGIHLLLIDLHPPTPRDPRGVHGAIWHALASESYEAPAGEDRTGVAYSAGPVKSAYVEPLAVGDRLPDAPLFLTPDGEGHVLVPLEETLMDGCVRAARARVPSDSGRAARPPVVKGFRLIPFDGRLKVPIGGRPMLEGLKAIDWASLEHAYGSAKGVPKAIRRLASPDPSKWVPALDWLHNTLNHQACDVYPATGPAVPFLVELLTEPSVRCRGGILRFLGRVAAVALAMTQPPEDSEDSDELEYVGDWLPDLFDRLRDGLDVYPDFVDHPDRRLRVAVPFALGHVAALPVPEGAADRRAAIVRRLADRFGAEPDVLVRASLVFGVYTAAGRDLEWAGWLRACLDDPHAGHPARLAALLCLTEGDGDLDPPLLDALLEASADSRRTDAIFSAEDSGVEGQYHPIGRAYLALEGVTDEPDPVADAAEGEDFAFPEWLWDRPSVVVLQRLARPRAAHAERVAPLLASRLDDANPNTAENIAEPILTMLLGSPDWKSPPFRPPPSPGLAAVLRRMHDNVELWATDVGNFAGVLKRFGLPEKRDGVGRLIGLEPSPPTTDAEILALLERLAAAQHYHWERQSVRRLILRQIGTADFLRHLSRYPDLEALDLSGVPVGDGEWHHLAGLTALRTLHLPGCGVGPAGVRVFAGLAGLRVLNLSGARIGDTDLEPLAALSELQSLWLYNVPVSDTALERLRTALPGCQVSR